MDNLDLNTEEWDQKLEELTTLLTESELITASIKEYIDAVKLLQEAEELDKQVAIEEAAVGATESAKNEQSGESKLTNADETTTETETSNVNESDNKELTIQESIADQMMADVGSRDVSETAVEEQ